MSELLGAVVADVVVDARSRPCPGPLLEARNAIAVLAVGQTLELQTAIGGSLEDIPAWCKKTGQEYLGHVEQDGYVRLFILKRR